MTFHMDVIKECLLSWINLKILEMLMQKPRAMSQRQLAQVIGISRATTQRVLKDLGTTGLIKSHRVGSATYWEVDKQTYLYETLAPLLRGLRSAIPPLLYLKKIILKTLKLPQGSRCFLFGSTVEHRDTPSSDIDLAIILPRRRQEPPSSLEQSVEDLHDQCREKFGKTLSIHYLSEESLKENGNELHRSVLRGEELRHDTDL